MVMDAMVTAFSSTTVLPVTRLPGYPVVGVGARMPGPGAVGHAHLVVSVQHRRQSWWCQAGSRPRRVARW